MSKQAQDKILNRIFGIEKAEWSGVVKKKIVNKLGERFDLIDYKLKGKAAMRKFFSDYTKGETGVYSTANQIADLILKKDKIKLKEFLNDEFFGETARENHKLLNILFNALEKNPTKTTLYRYETTVQLDGELKVGKRFNWGLRSTSENGKWTEKVAKRGAITDEDVEDGKFRAGKPIIYEIEGSKKAICIKDFSAYPEQEEWLVSGVFEAVEVDDSGEIIRVLLKEVKE